MTPTRAGVATALALAALVVFALPAGAHAALVSTSPAPGAILDDAPSQVTITFNEAVDVDEDSLRVVDATGAQISGEPRVDGSNVSSTLPTDVDGWFAVSWRIVSLDGHPLSGGWTYRVGEGTDEAPEDLQVLADGTQVYPDTDLAQGSAQWVSALATLALLGTVFVALVTPTVAAQRAIVPYLVGFSVAGAFFAAGLNGPATSVTTDWFDGPASNEYLARGALVLLGGTLLWALWERRWARVGAGILIAGGLCVTVLSGHARADGRTTMLVVMAHLVVASAWLGAVPAVTLAAWRGDEPAHTVLARFSRAAAWLAGAVLVLGGVAAWLLSGGLDTIAGRWGAILAVKVGLVALAIVAGAWTRFATLRRWPSRTPAQVRTPLLVEVCLLALVAAASIALGHNGPPEQFDGPDVVELSTTQDDVVVTVVVDPGEVGTNDLHVYVSETSGLPLPVEEATIELSAPDLGVGPITQELSDLGAGHFSGRTDDIGAPGTWQVTVVVRPTPFTQVVLDDTFEVD